MNWEDRLLNISKIMSGSLESLTESVKNMISIKLENVMDGYCSGLGFGDKACFISILKGKRVLFSLNGNLLFQTLHQNPSKEYQKAKTEALAKGIKLAFWEAGLHLDFFEARADGEYFRYNVKGSFSMVPEIRDEEKTAISLKLKELNGDNFLDLTSKAQKRF